MQEVPTLRCRRSCVQYLAVSTNAANDFPPSTHSLTVRQGSMEQSTLKSSKEDVIWYFGYGAMTNPQSRSLRGLPANMVAQPARLPNHKLIFTNGTGDVVESDSSSTVHGVLLKFESLSDWKIIEEFESGYCVRQGEVIPYDKDPTKSEDQKSPIMANYFQFPKDEKPERQIKLPTERYLRIICLGLEQHGVDSDYVQWLKKQPCNPSVQPQDYLRLDTKNGVPPAALPLISREEYEKRADDEWLILSGCTKVVQVLSKESDFFLWLRTNAIGQGCTSWKAMQVLYEPNLPICKSETDMTPAHYAWTEHELVYMATTANCPLLHVMNLKENEDKASRST